MLQKSLFFKNQNKGIVFEVILRAGKDIYPYCYPNNDLNSLDEYGEVEAVFFQLVNGKRGEAKKIEDILDITSTSNIDVVFCSYSLSFFDRVIVRANCLPFWFKRGEYFEKEMKKHGFERIENIPEETVPLKPAYMGVFCRACGEFNEYAEPDMVADDNKFTCWTCASHYSKRSRGLNENQVSQLLSLMKLGK